MFNDKIVKKFQQLPTPFYYYDLDILEKIIRDVREISQRYDYIVHYAIKANSNDRILGLINESGMGADCVSGNEVKKSIDSGFNAATITFAGVGKSDKEILFSLENDIFCFNCESVQEIEVINELASKFNKTANIALRINPDVNPFTHHYITTGLEENKFGINVWELDSILVLLEREHNVRLSGLHFHIGSQITDMNVFKSLCIRVNEIQKWFFNHRIIVDHINVGGGLGIDYENPDENAIPDFYHYFNVFKDFLELRPKQKLHFELGRAIVARCGDLISRVLYTKKGIRTRFIILDAGMTELIRPALYQSYHKIENISKPEAQNSKMKTLKYDVVGPICETSDCFGKAVTLPETNRGDIIAIRCSGAYGEVMSSSYNLRDKAKTVYSDEL